MASLEGVGSMSVMSGLVGLIIGLCITFLPSALAVLKGNVYKGQVIKYQLLVVAVKILITVAVSVISTLLNVQFVMILCAIGSRIWKIVEVVLWVYILIHVFRDTEMTLLSRFGINI